MAKIIVVAPPITGELSPLQQLAGGLAGRGHHITMVTGSRFRDRVESAGPAFTPVAGLADFDDRRFDADPERAKLAPGPEMINYDWAHAFANPVPELHAVLQRLLERDPGQYLVCITLWLGAPPVALGAPGRRPRRWVAVPLPLSSDDTTFFGPVPAGPDGDRKAANRDANAQFAGMLQPTQDRLEALLESLGATRDLPVFVDGVFTIPDATAALTVPGVEFARGDAPASLHLVGLLPGGTNPGWTPPAWWAELDGSRPVVVVTQGTLANRDLSELVESALAGLADRDVTVVAALGCEPGALSVPVPANARVVEFIPFSALLPKASVYITNGGYGGTQHRHSRPACRSSSPGSPRTSPPSPRGSPTTGLGISLQTGTPTPEAADQVARDCGLGSATNLRLHFRRVLDTTPTAYRRTFTLRSASPRDLAAAPA
jgi:hypothetical protein